MSYSINSALVFLAVLAPFHVSIALARTAISASPLLGHSGRTVTDSAIFADCIQYSWLNSNEILYCSGNLGDCRIGVFSPISGLHKPLIALTSRVNRGDSVVSKISPNGRFVLCHVIGAAQQTIYVFDLKGRTIASYAANELDQSAWMPDSKEWITVPYQGPDRVSIRRYSISGSVARPIEYHVSRGSLIGVTPSLGALFVWNGNRVKEGSVSPDILILPVKVHGEPRKTSLLIANDTQLSDVQYSYASGRLAWVAARNNPLLSKRDSSSSTTKGLNGSKPIGDGTATLFISKVDGTGLRKQIAMDVSKRDHTWSNDNAYVRWSVDGKHISYINSGNELIVVRVE